MKLVTNALCILKARMQTPGHEVIRSASFTTSKCFRPPTYTQRHSQLPLLQADIGAGRRWCCLSHLHSSAPADLSTSANCTNSVRARIAARWLAVYPPGRTVPTSHQTHTPVAEHSVTNNLYPTEPMSNPPWLANSDTQQRRWLLQIPLQLAIPTRPSQTWVIGERPLCFHLCMSVNRIIQKLLNRSLWNLLKWLDIIQGKSIRFCVTLIQRQGHLWYGILEFNVPLDTV